MTTYLLPEFLTSYRPGPAELALSVNAVTSDTYTPGITATTATPVLGTGGFITGKWVRTGVFVHFWIDLSITASGTIQGTSWRLELPFLADLTFHTGSGLLDAAADYIGDGSMRSGTAAQSGPIGAILGEHNSVPGTGIVMYPEATNTSLGSGDFTTTARIHVRGMYKAAAAAFP